MIQKKGLQMLNFSDLLEKIKRHESQYSKYWRSPNRTDVYLGSILGIDTSNHPLKAKVYKADHGDGKVAERFQNLLREKMVRWCNYRDVDIVDFFDTPLEEQK